MSRYCFLFVLLWYCVIPVAAQTKLALVIGNAEYDFLDVLNNAGNDATDIAAVLREMDFEVDYHLNLTKVGFKEAVKAFGQKAKDYDIILFYYAGHGIEQGGKNYFVPIDASARSASEVKKNCVSANAITHFMNMAKAETNIIILDACRENPFKGLPDREAHDGLALMDAPAGTIISFATAPGKVASDGLGDNGVFTDALLKHLPSFDMDLKDVFERVRNAVVESTRSRQIPWESTSLTQEVILRPKPELPIQLNILEGDSVIFEGNGELHAVSNLKGVSFIWYYNGRQFSNAATTEVNKTGRYQVKAISKAGQILLSAPIAVQVKSFVDPFTFVEEGRSVTFDNAGVLHGRSNVRGQYVWFKDNNRIAEGTEVQVSLPGTYKFQVLTPEGITAISESVNVRINEK
ncbi:MAG: caspase family protein [Bacteroidota bacterium]